MDDVFQYQIPELHPLAVHFPLALLLTATFPALLWMWRGTTFWRGTTWLMTSFGTIGAFFAYYTGDPIKEQSEGVPIVDELVGLHEDMAAYTLAGTCLVTLLLTVQSWWTHRRGLALDPAPTRIAIGLLVFVVGALVAWTAHIGATMTWGVVP